MGWLSAVMCGPTVVRVSQCRFAACDHEAGKEPWRVGLMQGCASSRAAGQRILQTAREMSAASSRVEMINGDRGWKTQRSGAQAGNGGEKSPRSHLPTVIGILSPLAYRNGPFNLIVRQVPADWSPFA